GGGIGAGLDHPTIGRIDHQQDAVRLDRAGNMDRVARAGGEVGDFWNRRAYAVTVPASPVTTVGRASCPWKWLNMAAAAVAARERAASSGRACSRAARNAGQPGPSPALAKWRTTAARSGTCPRRWRAIRRPPSAEPSTT